MWQILSGARNIKKITPTTMGLVLDSTIRPEVDSACKI
jgi:hypothetical protein